MTELVHLAWHDMRSQRVPFLVFAALLTLEAAWIVSGWVPDDRRLTVPWVLLSRGLMTSLLAALTIQRDALVGTTAFWRTRPIGRATLFASKLLSMSLALVVVPAAVLASAYRGAGLLWPDVSVVAGTIGAEQAMVALITAMAAVVTASLTHLVVAGTAGIALVTLANGLLLPAIMTNWPFVGESLGGARPALYLGTLFAFGLAAVAHQFFTLREWRTAALVAVALVAAALPPRLVATGRDFDPVPVNRAVVDPNAVSLSVVPGSFRPPDLASASNPRSPRAEYSGSVTVEGLADGVFVRVMKVDGRIEAGPDNVPFSGRPGYQVLGATAQNASWSGVQAALGQSRLLTAPAPPLNRRPGLMGIATVEREAALRLSRGRQTLVADVELAAGRFRIAGATALRPGARLPVAGAAIDVLRVTPGSTDAVELRIIAVERPTFGRFWAPALCLRNQAKQQAVRVIQTGYRSATTGALGMLSVRMGHARTVLRLPSNELPVDGAPLLSVVDADWLAGAELVYLDIEELGTFTRPLRAEFTVPDEQRQE